MREATEFPDVPVEWMQRAAQRIDGRDYRAMGKNEIIDHVNSIKGYADPKEQFMIRIRIMQIEGQRINRFKHERMEQILKRRYTEVTKL